MENWLAGDLFQWSLPPLPVPQDMRFEGKRCFHIVQLFKRHNLDSHNLRHWHVLIWILAGNPKRRPQKWDSRKLMGLRFVVDSVKRSDPQKDDTAICKKLGKKWGIGWQTLRRKLQDARKEPGYQHFCKELSTYLQRDRQARRSS